MDIVKIPEESELHEVYAKECPQDCVQDRYSLTQSFSDFSDNLKADLASKINQAGASSTTNVVMLKFFLNSLEYTKIHNFPQHGLQFVAEVSIISAQLYSKLEVFPYSQYVSNKQNPYKRLGNGPKQH